MFGFIQKHLRTLYQQFTTKINALFLRNSIDTETLKELESLLLQADTGAATTQIIIEKLKSRWNQGIITNGAQLHTHLADLLMELLPTKQPCQNAQVYMLVGINGSGKTTFAGKLAHQFQKQNKKVLLVAADTFRAAAVQQLTQWAHKTNTQIVTGKQEQDPASVVFAGCEIFKQEHYDVLIIDTAGRLQTKINLMKELEKIRRIISKQLPNTPLCTLLTLDSMLGQNSFEQAKVFHQSTAVDGIVLTKMDGTAKGGIVFHISQELGIPICYLSFGESLEQLKSFNPQEFIANLLGDIHNSN